MTHDLEQGRALYENRAWKGAYEALVRADEAESLGAQDLERLATAAFMLGRDDDYLALHERAHHAYLAADDLPNAVRCAFWVGLNLVLRGEMGPGSGWLGRAQRLLERHGEDCVERAYLLTPRIFQLEAAGDFDGAAAVAAEMLASRRALRRSGPLRNRPPRSGSDDDQDGSGQGRPCSHGRGDGRGDRR